MRWPLGNSTRNIVFGQEFDDFSFYLDNVFSRHVRISGSPLVIKTECSKCADGLPSAVTTVQPSDKIFTPPVAHIDHGLDGEHHAGLEARAGALAAIIGDLRLLVQLAPDAVADEFPHDAVAIGDDLVLDGGAQIAEAAPLGGEGDGDGAGHSSVTWSRRWTAGSMTPTGMVVAVSPTQPLTMTPMSSFTMSPYWMRRRAADAVHDLVIDGDADIAGEAAVIEEGALRIGLAHEGGGGAIHLAGGDAGLDEGAGALEDLAGDAAGECAFFRLPGCF